MTAVGLTRLVRWLSLLIVLGCAGPSDVASAQKHEGTMIKSTRSYEKPGDDVLRKKLSPLEYEVTQRGATEPAFHNKYWNQHEAGLYVDVATGEPLFSSTDKFDSGTGWPSFSKPVEGERVIAHEDRSYGMVRTEVLSRAGRSHLGHVFDDGPGPTGLRYCINSAALRFVPVAKLAEEGYEAYLPLFGKKAEPVPTFAQPAPNACTLDGPMKGCQATLETVILAGGCFWGMEELLRKIPGVMETEVGYEGGSSARPNYESVKTGATGHAESVRVVFDPAKLTFEELLEKWFFRMHDPTTPNRQGNDVGTQYRSAIFVTSPAQRETAKRVIERVTLAKKWPRPIVTQVVDAGPFTPAEDYHQDYLQKHPNGYTCHFLRD